MNVIKQIVKDDSQTIKVIVKDSERGPQGERGEPGAAATIRAGNAYSVPSNSDPSVINTGSDTNAVFDFYIPKGERGEPGIDGVDGKDGKDGAVQYVAGTGIEITAGNVIQATGAAVATWGGIQGTLSDQTDLENALNAKQNTLTAGDGITIDNDVVSADIVPDDYFTADATVNGSGSTLTLNNTIETKLDNVELLGDTTQQTYTGKNLIDYLNATYFGKGASYTVDGNVIAFSKHEEGVYKYCALLLSLEDSQKLYGKTVTLSYNKASSINDVSCGIRVFWCNPNSLAVSNALNNGFTQTSGQIVDTFSVQSTPPDVSQPQIALCIYPDITNAPVASSSTMSISNLQLEIGSSATTYEPYVGGIPAPNPSYPQDVQVVTGEQTVKVTGKNLAPLLNTERTINGVTFTPNSDGSVTLNGTSTAACSYCITADSPSVPRTIYLPAGTYTANNYEHYQEGYMIQVVYQYDEPKYASSTFTVPESVLAGVYIRVLAADLTFNNLKIYPQLELGSTATAYEPYQGQTYPLTLGSTELCKIGTYQDYIYKSGGDWYVHKEVGESILGDLTWVSSGTAQSGVYRMRTLGLTTLVKVPSGNNKVFYGQCSHFIAVTADTGGTYGCNIGISSNTAGHIDCYTPDYNTSTSAPGFKTWLTNNNVILYYALATPTDTQITDNTLLGQLNALAGAKTYNGQTNFFVVATGTNLPVILDVDAYRSSLAATNDLLATIPGPQVQSDWAESNSSAVSFIKNKPAINNATLTIKQNGTSVATFTANSATNATANITSPVITMTNTDPGAGSPLATNNFVAVYGDALYNPDFSTLEVSTGVKWVDGKTVYKKTIDFGVLPNATDKSVAHGISNLHRVVDIDGYAFRSSDSTTFPIPFVSSSSQQANIGLTIDNTNIVLGTGTDRSNVTECFITLYYTKSA